MPAKSRIDKLDEGLRVVINSALREGTEQKVILERVNSILEANGQEPLSKSSLSRYAVRVGEVEKRMRRAKEYADRLTSNLSEAAGGTDLGRAATEMFKTMVFDKMLDLDGEEEDIDYSLGELFTISRTLKNVAQASKLDLERELRIKTEARKQALEDAANVVDEAAKEAGLSGVTVQAIKSKILGVRSKHG